MAQDIVDLVSERLKKDYGLTFSPGQKVWQFQVAM